MKLHKGYTEKKTRGKDVNADETTPTTETQSDTQKMKLWEETWFHVLGEKRPGRQRREDDTKKKNREKVLAMFPWSGKKSQRRQNTHTVPPGRKRQEGRGKKKTQKRVKTTGVRGGTIFYSQSES